VLSSACNVNSLRHIRRSRMASWNGGTRLLWGLPEA
jgi:hypothetical protein